MKIRHPRLASALLAVTLMMLSSTVPAKDSLDQRVQRMERMLESKGLMDLFNRLEQLQREVQQLRGEIEVQDHLLKELQRRQRDLYVDVDQRVHALESGSRPAAASPPATDRKPAAPPVAPSAPPPASAPEPGAAPVVDLATERDTYQRALDILREGRYEEAASAFQAFLQDYPSSSYADNAQYWLGEAHYVTRQFDMALADFSAVITRFPDSPKVPDSLLKKGFIYYELQDWAGARKSLQEVTGRYPDSTAARLAGDRLQRMKSEGH
jgi:tol-pal system protein YbgF